MACHWGHRHLFYDGFPLVLFLCFSSWAQIHCAFRLILWQICSVTVTIIVFTVAYVSCNNSMKVDSYPGGFVVIYNQKRSRGRRIEGGGELLQTTTTDTHTHTHTQENIMVKIVCAFWTSFQHCSHYASVAYVARRLWVGGAANGCGVPWDDLYHGDIWLTGAAAQPTWATWSRTVPHVW